MQKSPKQAKDTSTAAVGANAFSRANVSKKVRGVLSVVSQRPVNDAALRSFAKVPVRKTQQPEVRWQRDFTNVCGSETMRSSCRWQMWRPPCRKKKKKQNTHCGWSVGTYGAKMCKINLARFRRAIRVCFDKRLFTVRCRNALDGLWCSQSLHSSFNTIKQNKINKNNCI